jgi:hypothetical protein
MTPWESNLRQTLIYQPALLSFESQRDYTQLEQAIRNYIGPRDTLEEVWTFEIIESEWEMQRYRRHKSQIVALAKPNALRNLMNLVLDVDESEIDDLASRWYTNKAIKKKINAKLREFGFDESSIGAEAYRLCIGDLAAIDHRLTILAARRDKVFRQIEDYRAGLSAPKTGSIRRLGQELRFEDGGGA